MPKPSNPCEFTQEELLALLYDHSVSVEAIAEEMETAGTQPLPPNQLQRAREVLEDFGPERAGHFEDMDCGLRDLLLELAQKYSATELIATLASSSNKGVAKQAKRAIHLLRSRGVQVDSASLRARPSSSQSTPENEKSPSPGSPSEEPALMSIPDSNGQRSLYLPFMVRGGIDLAYLQLSDQVGILRAEVFQLNRSAYRRALYDFRRAGSLSAPVPMEYACGLALACLDLNAKARRTVPAAFNDVAFLMGSQHPRLPSPGREIKLDAPSWIELVARGVELFAHPVIQFWPEAMARRPLSEAFSAALPQIREGVELDAPQVQEAIEGQINGDFGDALRTLYTERLLDAAAVLRGLEKLELAQIARATAEALERGIPASAIPFVVGLYSSLVRDSDESGAKTGSPAEKLLARSTLEALSAGKHFSDVLSPLQRASRSQTAKVRKPQSPTSSAASSPGARSPKAPTSKPRPTSAVDDGQGQVLVQEKSAGDEPVA